MHIAVLYGNVDAVRYLRSLVLSFDSRDNRGWSVLHFAAANNRLEVLETVLEHLEGVKCDENTWTPLHLACKSSGPRALDLLLGAGFKPTTVQTEHPLRQWSLYDVAYVHGNGALISPDGEALHDILQTTKDTLVTKNLDCIPHHESDAFCHDLGIDLQRYKSLTYHGLACNGCEHNICGPAYKCTICPDFDYCFMCRFTAEKTHEHSSWKITMDTIGGDYLAMESKLVKFKATSSKTRTANLVLPCIPSRR
ncbi:hypothetical protein BCR34DRAFT_366015 [Clohesyomyces aquaticus]|uniref:ZZ-type domain-containing protein n=1 Tax=Clohesyomyces aquaticus TaxID=1231657 RepID=A0A1Y1ZHN3_9PLEO|nr:hypothetical protein BCR34DRAFT_366015 [Clohesyomyces aquaticus]